MLVTIAAVVILAALALTAVSTGRSRRRRSARKGIQK